MSRKNPTPHQRKLAKIRNARRKQRHPERAAEVGRRAAKKFYHKDLQASREYVKKQQVKWRSQNKELLAIRGKHYGKKWYNKLTAEKISTRNKDAMKRIRHMKVFLNEFKVKAGCVDCGYNKHPAALHFDHVRGDKLFCVSMSKSIAMAKEEMQKCEVRCANCHAIKHAVSRGGNT